MEIIRRATAGTLESSDAFVEIEANPSSLDIQLESVVREQFGDSILQSVREVLDKSGVTKATVCITDRGALDCVIRARVETAILRGKEDA